MKKNYTRTFLTAVTLLFLSASLFAQTTIVSSFEDLALPVNTFWDGSDQSGGFTSGQAEFSNTYDPSFGGYWAFGWTYSSLQDSTTQGYTNPYSARTGTGYNSSTYGVGQQNATITFTPASSGWTVDELYITNSTYAALSMQYGDGFAKKFGGTSGNDPDWFKLKIYGYINGLAADSTEIYLADFRFADNSQDYILRTWQRISIGFMADSLRFNLSSSDNGSFGMNTPGYFAIDDIKRMEPLNVISKNFNALSVFPNPAKALLHLNTKDASTIRIVNGLGQQQSQAVQIFGDYTVDVSHLSPGLYFIEASTNSQKSVKPFIKE